MRRCGVCRRTGHTVRAHDNLTVEQLAELRADGLAYLGRGFKELDEVDQGKPDLFAVVETELVQGVTGGAPLVGSFADYVGSEHGGRPIESVELPDPGEGWGEEFPDDHPYRDGDTDDLASSEVAEPDTSQVTAWPVYSDEAQLNYAVEDDPAHVGCSHCGGSDGDHWEGCLDAVRPTEPAHWPDKFADPSDIYHPHNAVDVGELGPQFVPWRTPLGPDGPIQITLPGVYEISAAEYHDPAVTGDWVSNSDLRGMTAPNCPAKWRYNRDHGVRGTSDAFAFGHAWHARVLGKGEDIAVRPVVWDSWRTNAAKAWRAEQEAAGRSVILPEDWQMVEAMAAAIHDRPRAHELLSQPGRPEVAMFWVDPETGVKRRALVDYLPSDRPDGFGTLDVVDIKSCDSASPDDRMEKKIYDYGYHRQGTTIADGAMALGLADNVTVWFIFQEKSAPYIVQEVELDGQAQRIGRIENHEALLLYKQCIETGVWPSYADGPVTVGVPGWIANRFDDEMVIR
jgi:PDDEXK-like uncharacterized protein DUF3799